MADIISAFFKNDDTVSKSDYAKHVQDILNSGLHVDPNFREFLLQTLVNGELFETVQSVEGDQNVLANYLGTELYDKGKGKGTDLFFGPWKSIAKAAVAFAALQSSTASANMPGQLDVSSYPVQHGFMATLPPLTTIPPMNKSYYTEQKPLPSHLDIENLDSESKERVIKYRKLRDTYLKQGTSVPSAPEYDFCAKDDKLCGKYPRYIMPQIDDLDKFITDVNEIGIDMMYSNESITPDKLFSSQSEVSKFGVEKKIKNLEKGKGDKAIIISQDNYVIDGHHRLSALTEQKRLHVPISVKRINQKRDYIFEAAAAADVDMAPRATEWSALYPGSVPVTYNSVSPFAQGY